MKLERNRHPLCRAPMQNRRPETPERRRIGNGFSTHEILTEIMTEGYAQHRTVRLFYKAQLGQHFGHSVPGSDTCIRQPIHVGGNNMSADERTALLANRRSLSPALRKRFDAFYRHPPLHSPPFECIYPRNDCTEPCSKEKTDSMPAPTDDSAIFDRDLLLSFRRRAFARAEPAQISCYSALPTTSATAWTPWSAIFPSQSIWLATPARRLQPSHNLARPT